MGSCRLTLSRLTGICQSYGSLIACRLLLGAVEGGLFPGAAIYLTLFYTKREIAVRIGYLFVSAAVAGACGGLLAYGIGFMDGIAGQRGWRWILILEGLPTFVLGIPTWFLLADDPESAYYLSEVSVLSIVPSYRACVARMKITPMLMLHGSFWKSCGSTLYILAHDLGRI